MPNLYHSDVHLPRWKRLLLWLLESPTAVGVWSVSLGLLCGLPVLWFGLWWPVAIVAIGMSFVLGWNCARRQFLQDGRIDPL